MKLKFFLLFLITLFLSNFALSGKYDKVEKRYLKKVKNLDKKYQDFYRMVYWISTKKERKTFLKLKNNSERDNFIKDFWKCRDLNPKTPENEYKKAYELNFLYVQKYFSIKGVRPGWLTDRGRIFLILGKPASVSRNPLPSVHYPTEVWTYYGNPSLGLPPKFVLYFIDKSGSGLYKLYSPSRNRNRGSSSSMFSPTPMGDDNSSFAASNNTNGYLINDSQSASFSNMLNGTETLYQAIFSLPKKLFKPKYLEKYRH